MAAELKDCPWTDTSISNPMLPWILPTLHNGEGDPRLDPAGMIRKHHEALDIILTGLYRHPYALGQRGMPLLQRDRSDRGRGKRSHALPSEGKAWLTKRVRPPACHAKLIVSVFDCAEKSLSELPIPAISVFPPSPSTS